jgi:hypothetical protein
MARQSARRIRQRFARAEAQQLRACERSLSTLNSVPVWSVAAKRATSNKEVMIEHGTPKSEFVKLVYDVYLAGRLTEEVLISMMENLWKIAVITKEEDARLSGAGLRSKRLESPEARWAAVGIQFAEQEAQSAQ